jgi:hypothetical protein
MERRPRVRAAAALRLALLTDPAVRPLKHWMDSNEHPAQSMAAIKEVLERNQ